MNDARGTADNKTNGKRFLVGVAVSIAVPMLIQTCALCYWAGGISARVKNNEHNIHRVSELVDSHVLADN